MRRDGHFQWMCFYEPMTRSSSAGTPQRLGGWDTLKLVPPEIASMVDT
jgi:hypothetical protein